MNELVERYLRTRRDGMGESTYDNIKSTLDRLAASWDATRRQPSGMDEEWLRDWLWEFRQGRAGGHGKKLANASYNKTVTRTKGFIEYLVRRGIVQPFVLDACQSLPREEPKDYLRLSAAQVVHMIETCEDPWERWVLVLASQTLGRDSELRNRRIAHLNTQTGELAWFRKKTTDADQMPVTRQLAEEWQRWAYVYQGYCGSLDKQWFLIPARISTPFSKQRWIYRPEQAPSRLAHIVQKHAARITGDAQIALKGQGVHITRRSMARALYDRLVANEVPEPTALNRVQVMLGHASPSTTMIYIGVQPDRLKRNQLLAGSDLLWVERKNVVALRSVGNE
jgi:integrase